MTQSEEQREEQYRRRVDWPTCYGCGIPMQAATYTHCVLWECRNPACRVVDMPRLRLYPPFDWSQLSSAI